MPSLQAIQHAFPHDRELHASRECDLDESAEMEVIKTILLREEYIGRVKANLNSQGAKVGKDQAVSVDLTSLLDLLRSTTVDTIEAIQRWRRIQGNPNAPFIWRGVNYILKIPTDINFLDDYKLLRTWLGFSLGRNPFLCPAPLEKLAGVSPETRKSKQQSFSMDKKGFYSVGGGIACPTADSFGTESQESRSKRIGGSAIADVDMMRIRGAASTIIREETTHGRYTVDSSTRFVLVGTAEKSRFARQLEMDDKRGMHLPAKAPRDIAPFTGFAGIGRVPEAILSCEFGECRSQIGDRRDQSSSTVGHSFSGKAIAKLAGGRLRPVAVNSTPPRTRTPIISRSVGAMLRAEMMHRRQQNKQLQKELEDLRQNLSRAYATSPTKTRCESLCHMAFEDSGLEEQPDDESHTMKHDGQESFVAARSKIQRKAEELERKEYRQAALEKQYHIFQAKEREAQNRKRAIVLERKRRLLDKNPDLLQPCVDDEYTLEDAAATQIQRVARGVQSRTWVKNLRPLLHNAATKIQSTIRGHLGRCFVQLKVIDKFAITNIQRIWRGYLGRCAALSIRQKLEKKIAARNIQKMVRGRQGRRRVDHKRGLRESARNGAEVVGVKQLFHQDIVELADAVEALLVDNRVTPLPGIALGLLKVVALMLDEKDESGCITRYSALGVKNVKKLEPGLHFSWRDALSLLRRSNKLLRRLRQVAEGPSSRRPRMVHFSQTAAQVYAALRRDRGWNVTSIGRVGRGAKACQHLMMWVDALQEVFTYQREFADDLGSDRMSWVSRAHRSMRCMRHLELSRMLWEHAVRCMEQILLEARDPEEKQRTSLPTTSDSERRRGDLRIRVAENALKVLRSRETCARDALERMRKEEEDAQKNDDACEQLKEDTLVEDLNHAETSLADSLAQLKEAKRMAQDGVETDQVRLQHFLDELTTCEVVRRERWTTLEMFRTQRARNSKWKGVAVEVWGDLRHQLRVVGELEATSFLAAEDLSFALDGSESIGVADSTGSRDHEMEVLRSRANEAQSLAAEAQDRLATMQEEKETAHATACEAELQREESVVHHEWDDPTEEEVEEDLREDEKCARWEALAATQFVPVEMIARPFRRPRPIILCLSRDLPEKAKKNMVKQLESDLPGLTIHIDEERNMGLHVDDLQQAMSIRCNLVCNVDIGIGGRRRKAFLQRLATVKDALIPTPNFILVTGDSKNRSGGPLDGSVGCSARDLSVMGDGAIKKRLEDVARIVKEIQDPVVLEAIARMGQQFTPPSPAHALVMEAVIILLTPQTVFHNRVPMSSLRGVTWTEARHILGNPERLWSAIARVDAYSIPPANLSTLQAYIEHGRWPRKSDTSSAGATLESLAAWASSTIEICSLLTIAGGKTEDLCHYSATNAGLLASVVPVHDDSSCTQRNDEVDIKRGWRAAYNQTMTALLEDVRVFRVAKRVRGSPSGYVQLIEVYQECERLFFHIYDPESSVSSLCVIEEAQISHLLAPTLDQPPELGPSTAPCNRQDMFSRLVTLLGFEVARSNRSVRKQLTCKRRLRRLLRDTRQISGHLAQVTVYEEAKGELRYSLYLADFAARIQLKVDAASLEKVLEDSCGKTGERQAITSEDSDQLLVPITDRLVISPSRTVVSTMGACRAPDRKKASSSSEGFVLKIRHKGGPGRRVLRAVCRISGSSHVVSAWELGRGGLLRLTAYDPRTSMTYETRLSEVERACFGFDSEHRKLWIENLGRRLSLRRSKDTSDAIEDAENRKDPLQARLVMTLDKTVFSTACHVAAGQIGARLFRMRAELVDAGKSFVLNLYQCDSSKQCRILLSGDDLVEAGLQPCTGSTEPDQAHGSRVRETGTDQLSEQDRRMANLLVGPGRKETAVRQLTRQLRYIPESDSVVFSVNGDTRTTSMTTPIAAEQRRPQRKLKVAFSLAAGNAESCITGHRGFVRDFLMRRHQPRILLHRNESGRTLETQAHSTHPREPSSKHKKSKQKRDKKHNKPVKEDGKLHRPLSMPSDENMLTPRKNTNVHHQDDVIESKVDPTRSLSGKALMCLPRDGERKIFYGAISIRRDDWELHQPVCDTVVTVYKSYASDTEVRLRAVVYYTKMAAYAEVSIIGFQDLRQVVGALHQSLAQEWKHQPEDDGAAEALFTFIFHERAMIVAGTWDADRDGYVEHGSDFTVLLKRSRLYRSFKQTPVHLSGVKDAQSNTHQLIDDAIRRGKKVFRRAVNISSILFQVTAYELPPSDTGQDEAPTMKFIAYDPKTQMQLVAVIQPGAVLELGGGRHSPWMAQDKREILAEILVHDLRLKTRHDGTPSLILPWSGENLKFADEVQPGETSRPRRDKVLACAKRDGLSRLEVFSTRVTDYEVVITVFAETDALSRAAAVLAQDIYEEEHRPTLTFNLYLPKLSESVDIDLSHDAQKTMIGRNILHIPKGEARSSAIHHAARFLRITLSPSSNGLQAEFLFEAQKPWLVAYNELDASDRPSPHRPRGQPLIFIPGDTNGDLIMSKGIALVGFKVLLSVHTKERGRSGREGLVMEAYNQETSASCTLHLSASSLLNQVDEKDHLLTDDRLLTTIDMLTKRLRLKKSAVGGWDLIMDRTLEPFLFMGM